ncbi:unnamed protein product, partial [Adineta ricciae]
MAAIRPPSGPQFPDRMSNPIFPPNAHPIQNGLPAPSFPPSSNTSSARFPPHAYQPNSSNFSPVPQYQPTSMSQHMSSQTPPLPTSNFYQTPANPAPPLLPSSSNAYPTVIATTHNPSPQPPVRPMYPSPASAYRAQIQPLQPTPQTLNPNIQPPSSHPFPQYGTVPNPMAVPQSHIPSPAMYPGQQSQPVTYGMGGNMTNMMGQPTNTINGSYSTNNNYIIDLLKEKTVVSPFAEDALISPLLNEDTKQMSCSPEVMRCSLNVIPQTKDLLNKSRLPLGILIHPFKDLDSLSVIQGSKIVRCDGCKSYINPFVTFLDNTRWRCSICFRMNDLPQEFLFDPVSKTYGDPSRRPEVRFGTVEYTATSDYM